MKYDIMVIGSGPGGYVAAIRAAQLGSKTAVVERAELGGVCLNWGCIPTKALLKSAQVYRYARSGAEYGVETESVRPDVGKMIDRSRSIAETMNKGIAFLLKKNGVEVIEGSAMLRGGGRIAVALNAGGVEEFEAEHIILATGSRPKELPFMPVDGTYVITSRQALSMKRIPESIVVVGSGAIGCEFASFYASLGSKVTIVEYMPNLMPLEDEDVSKQMERSFRKMKMTVMTSATVKNVAVDHAQNKCLVEVENKKGLETITADVVLSAVGIKSNIEGLGLETAGVSVERDKVVVDKFYRTTAEGVYAIGDIVASPALAHVAWAEAMCCIDAICGLQPEQVDYRSIPSCIYTSPEVASVGMTERQAVENGMNVRIGKFPFTASGKATASGDRDGFVKLVFDADTDVIVGAHLVGANVTEMISELTLAKRLGVTAQMLGHVVHPHPTMSEAVMEAAEAAHGACIHT